MAVTIKDELGALDASQKQQLQDRFQAYRFDAYVLVGDGTLSKRDFDARVSSYATGEHKTLSIGIDPKHRHTFVRASSDFGLPDGPEVAAAGNGHFKRGDLVGGIDAIAAKAREASAATRVVQGAGGNIVVHEQKTSAGVWWLLGGVSLAVLIVAGYAWIRARKRDREHRERMAELDLEISDRQLKRLENEEEQDFERRLAGASVSRPALGIAASERAMTGPQRGRTWDGRAPAHLDPFPAPAVHHHHHQQSGGNDLLTGVLIGNALSDHGHSTREVVHERVVERAPDPEPASSSSWDSGSSSSSWDSGGSSSSDSGSSSDGGGGGSDW